MTDRVDSVGLFQLSFVRISVDLVSGLNSEINALLRLQASTCSLSDLLNKWAWSQFSFGVWQIASQFYRQRLSLF